MSNLPNILSLRYASPQINATWSPENKILLEREFWIAVMKAQSELGVDIPAKNISDYEAVKEKIDLAAIRNREKALKHDVKSRIEEFNSLANHQDIHKGLTSRDLTENVEQLQIKKSLEIIRFKYIAVLARLAQLSTQYSQTTIVARTHNVPAQVTTLGKRFATWANEALIAFENLERLISSYPLRGIKGPVGTAQDMIDLLGDIDKFNKFEKKINEFLGFENSLLSVGQIYPRSLDFEVVSVLMQLAAPLSSMATTIRLMAGNELVSEGFSQGQVGSSAMPHKINARSSERINGLTTVLRGYLTMTADLAGSTWNEGDVACSTVRRVALPDSFFTIDGILETSLTILDEFGAFEPIIQKELNQYLPFLTTTAVLMQAIKNGVGRETAHEAIKMHALKAIEKVRNGHEPYLPEELLQDQTLKLTKAQLEKILNNPIDLIGAAAHQVREVAVRVNKIVKNNPDAARYVPEPIL
ncbi:MAG: adenylosuccinate lyase [Candidatus Nanopelagicales bacterium]